MEGFPSISIALEYINPPNFVGRRVSQPRRVPDGPVLRRARRQPSLDAGNAGPGGQDRLEQLGRAAPGRGGRTRRVLGALRRRGEAEREFTTSLRGRRGAFFPLERLERVVPLELLDLPRASR